jgi:hypothetical protein
MEPNPSVANLTVYSLNSQPWDIDAVMAGALKLNMTFTINLPNETRIVPSTVYLGHDSQYLYVGGQFQGMYLNPNDYDGAAFANMFGILFDVTDNGTLTFPEAGSLFGDSLWQNASLQFNEAAWSFDDVLWWKIPWEIAPTWNLQSDFYSPKAEPAFAEKDTAAEYDNLTGTLTVLFSRYLWCPANSLTNAFQMRPGERWVMGFMLILGYASTGNLFTGGSLVTWPEGYSFESSDSSWWPKLVIDLTNPPATYPGDAPATYPSAGLQACEGTGLNLMSPFLMLCSSAL